MYKNPTRSAWVEVNLDNYISNLKYIKSIINKNSKIMCVIKSDGYRAGALELTEASIKFGINYFGVATLSEGISLRKHFKDINILILGYTPSYLLEDLCKYDIMPNIYSYDNCKDYNEICKKYGKVGRIHLSIDTGMNRVGFIPGKEAFFDIIKISKLSNIKIDGVFSHFAKADVDEDFTKKQFDTFTSFTKEIENAGVNLGLKHISNSASILKHREYDLDMVRPGAIMHGLYKGFFKDEKLPLKKDLQVFAMIANIKTIKKGQGVSYGHKYIATKDTKVVTIPLGYADGFPRILSGKFSVLIGGKKCPQIGNICMDQFMVDATGIDCKINDVAVLLGKDGDEEISAFDLCQLTGDIELSFIDHLNYRMPITFIENNKIKCHRDLVRDL